MNQVTLKEIENIRKYATKEEKGKLDAETFDGSMENTCVYGQMTGSCSSDRAKELIAKCIDKKEIVLIFMLKAHIINYQMHHNIMFYYQNF